MTHFNKLQLVRTGTLAIAVATGLLHAADTKKWTAPRTPDGQPDIQGIWTNATITTFERPKELAGKEFFTEQEAAEYEKKVTNSGSTAEQKSCRPGERRWWWIRPMEEFRL
jgi:hypothetical protein